MVENFTGALKDTAGIDQEALEALVGPYSRADQAHYDETDAISDYIADSVKDGIMLDVGAHYGSSAAHFLAKGWQVYGFEPDPNNRAVLVEKYGSHPKLKIFDLAVSDGGGQELAFYASNESTGISGLSAFHEKHEEVCKVMTTTLTDICQQENVTRVGFLKIDTEGHDLMVLKGFPWETMKPAFVECEYEDNKTNLLGYDWHELANFLVEKGYHVYVSEWHPIIRYGMRHNWQRLVKYPCQLSSSDSWGNLLAFLEEPNEEALLHSVNKLVSFPALKIVDGKLSFSPLQLAHTIARKVKNRIKRVLS